jgi:hypothetical protein
MKVDWETMLVETSKTVKIQNIVSATLNNYTDEDIYFLNKGVRRLLPKVSANGTPDNPFTIEINGFPFDIDIKIEFPSATGSLIIDYAPLKQC